MGVRPGKRKYEANMIIKKAYLIILSTLLIVGCEKIVSPKGRFVVEVVTSKGEPISSATIEGGIDWEFFSIKTDSRGVAILPSYARGKSAVIYKNNFFPEIIQSLSSTKYILKSTPKQFKLVGNVAGWSIRFNSGILITIDYIGVYHVYSYDEQSITEIASAQLPKCIKETQLRGDTLWFSTHDDGIYVYSLHDALQPQQLFHFSIPGYLGPFAVKDTIVAIGNPWERDSLRIFSYKSDGQYKEISNFGNYLAVKMSFISDFLVIVNYYDNLPAILDLQDPTNPRLVYNGVEPEYWSGFLFNNYLILIPRWELIEETTNYKLIDLSNPTNPSNAGVFSADSRLYEITNDNTAIGAYYSYSGAISVLNGSLTNGFQTTAIISEGTIPDEFGGCAPPYYIIGGRLWRLQDL